MNVYMRRVVLPKLDASDDRWQAAYDAPRISAATKRKLKRWMQVVDKLHKVWETDKLLTERHLAKICPLLGCCEEFEARIPNEKKIATTVRKVREIIEDLRKEFNYPILSTPAVKSANQNTPAPAGYWIARSQNEVDDYFRRTSREIKAVIESRIATFDSMRVTFDNTDDVFVAIKKAL